MGKQGNQLIRGFLLFVPHHEAFLDVCALARGLTLPPSHSEPNHISLKKKQQMLIVQYIKFCKCKYA